MEGGELSKRGGGGAGGAGVLATMMVMMRKIVIPGKLKTMMTVKPHKAIKTKSFVMVMMNFGLV